MKISARNILKGTITEIVKGAPSHVRIDIGGAVVTASIIRQSKCYSGPSRVRKDARRCNEAVTDLKLETGKQAYAVVKASDVMVGVD